MKALTDLNPEWTGLLRSNSGEGLTFDCPICGPSHRLCAYFDKPIDGKPSAEWQRPKWEREEGDSFSTLTLSPSIKYSCFHGWIEEGQVIDVSESPMRAFVQGLGIVALSPRQAKQVLAQRQGASR